MSTFPKDPDAVLDFKFDWATSTNGRGFTDWLDAGETIQSYTITAEAGITLDSDVAVDSNTSVVAWLSGGTAGTTYDVACKIITTAGRTDERTMSIVVAER